MAEYNEVGAGKHPKLGAKSFVEGLARPARGAASPNSTPKSVSDAAVGKPARPGGGQQAKARANTSGDIARPGGAQSAKR
jgi:hypothetical protein